MRVYKIIATGWDWESEKGIFLREEAALKALKESFEFDSLSLHPEWLSDDKSIYKNDNATYEIVKSYLNIAEASQEELEVIFKLPSKESYSKITTVNQFQNINIKVKNEIYSN